ncbi:MAG: hypothetical protein ABI614_11065, partial [Planctomycetota bacterium]
MRKDRKRQAPVPAGDPWSTICGQWGSPQVRWAAALALFTVLLYGRVIGYDFVNFDDDAHVYQNPQVQAGLSWSGLEWAFTIHGPSQWHPIAWL